MPEIGETNFMLDKKEERNFMPDIKEHTSPDKDLLKIKEKIPERRSFELFSSVAFSGLFFSRLFQKKE